MADINADEHGLVRDLRPKLHSPQVTAKLSVHLTDDVEENTVVILGNRAIGDEL